MGVRDACLAFGGVLFQCKASSVARRPNFPSDVYLHEQVYSDLIASWIARNFTLRYTGGMVPDVHHILAKVWGAGWSAIYVSRGGGRGALRL